MKSDEMKANITREIRKITEDELIHVNDNFIKRCQKCVDSDDITSIIAYNKTGSQSCEEMRDSETSMTKKQDKKCAIYDTAARASVVLCGSQVEATSAVRGDNAGEMSPRSSTESYPAFARIGLRENPGINLNQVTCPDRDSNLGHLVSRPDALTVTPQHYLQIRTTSSQFTVLLSQSLEFTVSRTTDLQRQFTVLELRSLQLRSTALELRSLNCGPLHSNSGLRMLTQMRTHSRVELWLACSGLLTDGITENSTTTL
ncbi:hypothetical protein ANN_10417 [Periplaneta americana]|uniref:Uncharacterized protein n=1 Tax=Periplaneta americana TaxID=6978 RepID=A0ABQ8TQK1_PERAM|nr:hypothetical protein ANN_10417 [Periplaneta americana]